MPARACRQRVVEGVVLASFWSVCDRVGAVSCSEWMRGLSRLDGGWKHRSSGSGEVEETTHFVAWMAATRVLFVRFAREHGSGLNDGGAKETCLWRVFMLPTDRRLDSERYGERKEESRRVVGGDIGGARAGGGDIDSTRVEETTLPGFAGMATSCVT